MSMNYPLLRSALRPEYAEASDDVVESVVARLYGPDVSADDAENFLGGIGRAFGDFGRGVANVARQAAPVLANALPGAMSGAATGAALGPWGALAGAAIGGITSAISGATARPPQQGGAANNPLGALAGSALGGLGGMGGTAGTVGRIAGAALPAVQRIASGDTRGGVSGLIGAAGQAVGAAAPGGIGGQIAGLLARPEVQQAITSQMLGAFGRNQVSVGGTPVPTGAVMNMLGSLFSQAAHESYGRPGESEALPSYLLTTEGEYAVDPADPDARGQWLAHLIASTPRPEPRAYRMHEAAFDEAYDDAYDEGWDDAEGWDDGDEAFDEQALAYSLDDLDDHDDPTYA